MIMCHKNILTISNVIKVTERISKASEMSKENAVIEK